MNLKNFQFGPGVTDTQLIAVRSHLDRLIERAVRTGSSTVFREIMDLPYSFNGNDRATEVRAILHQIAAHEGMSDYYRATYLNGVTGPIDVRDYFEGMNLDEEFVHKVANSFDWINSTLLQKAGRFRLKARPTPTRKAGKLVQTLFQAQHGLKLDPDDLLRLIWNCAPLLRPRQHQTTARRGQTDSFRKPKRKSARQWVTSQYEPELVKIKLLRNEIHTALDVVYILELLNDREYDVFADMEPGVRYAYVYGLLQTLCWYKEDATEKTAILDQLCSDGELVEQYMKLDTHSATNCVAEHDVLIPLSNLHRGQIDVVLSNLNTSYFAGTLRDMVMDAITHALQPYMAAEENLSNRS